jgi:hypothetical protein
MPKRGCGAEGRARRCRDAYFDPVREHPRAASHRGAVAAALADHGRRFAGDRRFIDRSGTVRLLTETFGYRQAAESSGRIRFRAAGEAETAIGTAGPVPARGPAPQAGRRHRPPRRVPAAPGRPGIGMNSVAWRLPSVMVPVLSSSRVPTSPAARGTLDRGAGEGETRAARAQHGGARRAFRAILGADPHQYGVYRALADRGPANVDAAHAFVRQKGQSAPVPRSSTKSLSESRRSGGTPLAVAKDSRVLGVVKAPGQHRQPGDL